MIDLFLLFGVIGNVTASCLLTRWCSKAPKGFHLISAGQTQHVASAQRIVPMCKRSTANLAEAKGKVEHNLPAGRPRLLAPTPLGTFSPTDGWSSALPLGRNVFWNEKFPVGVYKYIYIYIDIYSKTVFSSHLADRAAVTKLNISLCSFPQKSLPLTLNIHLFNNLCFPMNVPL